jgi:Mitochondrial carrier protein.
LNAFKYGFLALGMVPIYDQITEFWPRVLGEGFYIKPFCIGIASVSGALLSLPFDNIKTKYQRQVEKEYKSVADCYHKIIARESIFGLYTGFWHYAGRIGISSIFIVYFVDAVRDVLYSS